MKRVTKTFVETVEFDQFEPGDRIVPGELSKPLPPGVYVVTEFIPPMYAHEDPMVFVEGHPHGLNGHHFRLADPE